MAADGPPADEAPHAPATHAGGGRLDQIHIKDLLVRTIVGINPDERDNMQDVVLNIILHADLRDAGRCDEIDDTIDYAKLKKRILAHVDDARYFLIERLAQAVADLCLEDERIQAVDVTVDKPGALRFARSVAVSIHRTRQE